MPSQTHPGSHRRAGSHGPVPATPGPSNFISVIQASVQTGVSMRVFLAAVYAGDIPIAIYKIGKRRFVRSNDLNRWLETATPIAHPGRDSTPNPGLF